MTQIGFIGLGLMGNPMSKNLIKAGPRRCGLEPHGLAHRRCGGVGARRSTSPKEVAERSEMTITCLTDSPDVEEVILGAEGVVGGASQGSVVIDHSTIPSSVTRSDRKQAKGGGNRHA